MSLSTLIILALIAFALSHLASRRRPLRSHPLWSWRTVIAALAVLAAFFIVMNPEFYALGLLSDSTFFDLLVIALTFQLQSVAVRIGHQLKTAAALTVRYLNFSLWRTYTGILLFFAVPLCLIQKTVHRFWS